LDIELQDAELKVTELYIYYNDHALDSFNWIAQFKIFLGNNQNTTR